MGLFRVECCQLSVSLAVTGLHRRRHRLLNTPHTIALASVVSEPSNSFFLTSAPFAHFSQPAKFYDASTK